MGKHILLTIVRDGENEVFASISGVGEGGEVIASFGSFASSELAIAHAHTLTRFFQGGTPIEKQFVSALPAAEVLGRSGRPALVVPLNEVGDAVTVRPDGGQVDPEPAHAHEVFGGEEPLPRADGVGDDPETLGGLDG